MKRIVVDSSVCVNWFMQPRGKRERNAALDVLEHIRGKKVYVSQPSMWRAHVVSMLLRKRGADANNVLKTLLGVESRDENGADVLRLAVELATTLRADLFDTLYHAVAIDRNIELVTSNEDYVHRASSVGHIRLLSDWVARARIAERNKHYSRQRRTAVPDAEQKKH